MPAQRWIICRTRRGACEDQRKCPRDPYRRANSAEFSGASLRAGTRTRIRDTRKTTPGLRALEKYAVKTGGGANHRFGLYDAILLKENHIALAGGIKEALDKAHTYVSPKAPPPRAASAYDAAGLDPEVVGPGPLPVQVEVRDQKELVDALKAGAEAVLLDNMTPERAAACVKIARGIRAESVIEISGGITLENARAYAEAGADFLSSGALGACRKPQPACGQHRGNVSLGGAKRRDEIPMTQESLPGPTDRRLAGLLTLLAENATIVISGARIAKEVGVSRSMVWQWVERLRELGVKVKSQAGAGYFLEQVPDILTPDMLKQRLKGSLFGKRIYHFFKTDSTNRVALELGHTGEPEGAVVLAEEQTAGRGRAGRKWHSERAAGIYVTILLRPKLAPVQAPLLTMMAGLSAHTAVQALTGLEVDLKWPNDLIVRGKKVGGILTEMHAEPNQVRFVIVGVGLNVNQEKFPGELANVATSLRAETGKWHSRMELLVRLLREFESDYNRFLREGVASVVARFESVSSYAKGKRVRVTNGTESYVGTTAGLGPEGLLQVEREDGRVTAVISGDVTEAR